MTDLRQIEAALSYIPAHDRDTWCKIGMAVKSELGDTGFDLWNEWSANSDTYRQSDARAVWKSLKASGPVTIASLFGLAKEHGYRPDKPAQPIDPAEMLRRAAERQEAERIERENTEASHREAARKAADLWSKANPHPDPNHAYLTRKGGLPPVGIRQSGDALVIPLYGADKTLTGLQFIQPDGQKRFITCTRKAGSWCVLKPEGIPPSDWQVILLAEGWATAASLHTATGHPVFIAFDCGNLPAVARYIRQQFPAARLLVCADDDSHGKGQHHARIAASMNNGMAVIPQWGGIQNMNHEHTDFNDLHRAAGIEAVRHQIGNALENLTSEPAGPANDEPEAQEEWPEPMPLVKHYLPEEYPLDSLPDTIRAAVEEVAGFVKAPIPLIASSALAALSLACQAHADIKRAEKLYGPISLYMLAIADSGERKTTCDGFFMSAIRQFEREQTEAMKPAIQQYEAAFAAWDAEREGILSAIREAGKKGKPTHKMREDLEQLQLSKPESPPVPRLLLEDETPENLVWSLAKQWPSSGIISSEAGMVLGSHAMGRDSVMRNLATLNIVWDGGEFSIGRKTTESFKMRGGRATIALQTQEATLHNFLEKYGVLARGTGFLARFLVSWPASTQGSRMFTEAPMHWPHLSAFHARITAMLSQPFTLDEDGMLTPPIMSLSRGAKDAWIEYHDTIERGLTHGGELGDVRDVASKSADNAARLAALFQMFESGFSPVSQDVFDRASTIAAWHLSESRRFLGGFSLPREMGDATKLDGWIVEHCCKSRSSTVGKNYARQHGPIRDSSRLDAAIRELVELDRVRLEKDGKKTMIQVNPRLMR